MTVFLDTGVLYAHHDRDARRHPAAKAAMTAVLGGALGRPVISDYVFDEAVTLTLKRTGSRQAACALADRLLGRGGYPEALGLLRMEPHLFDEAVQRFRELDDQGLSFTDTTTLVLVERHRIDTVLTFDGEFDGLADRMDPATLAPP